ncbi:radical SAM protein [bacterium]|nr:radical SAM protein [candidate division CSSED10-310 bacterium]
MRTLMINSPWIQDEERYGVKAGSRWASIRPRRETLQYYPFPFFMAYAAASCKRAGLDVRLLDAVAEGMTTNIALHAIERFDPDICVIETATPSINVDLRFAAMVKERFGTINIMSGPHASAMPDHVLDGACDVALIAEYDLTLPDLIRTLERHGDLSEVQGIAYKADGQVVRTPPRPLIKDLDSLPYPERDDIPLDKYTDPFCKKFPNVCIISSRGCPYECIFCLEPYVFYGKPNYRWRRTGAVVDEIEFVMDRYGAAEIYFDDSSFSLGNKRAREISEEILRRELSIYWSCMGDARTDYETLALMKRAGCHGLKFGVESADERILANIKKPLDLANVRRFVSDCHALGIYTHGTFMFGLPGETRDSIRKTLEFAFDLKLTTAQFSVATPFPGTEFYSLAKENGWLTATEWESFEGGGTPAVEYPECTHGDIIAAVRESKKRKMMRVATNPRVLAEYLEKIYRMEGVGGVLRNLWDKGGFVLGFGAR